MYLQPQSKLEVQVEGVGACVHVTQFIIVGKGIAVVRTHKVGIGHNVTALVVNTDAGVGSGS